MTQLSLILHGLLCLVSLCVDAAPPCVGGHWINGTCQSCPEDHFYSEQSKRCEECPKGYVNPNGSLLQCKSMNSNPEVIENLPIPPTTTTPPIIQSSLIETIGYTKLTTLLTSLNISKTSIPVSTTAFYATNNNSAADTANPQNKNSNNTVSVSYDNQHAVLTAVATAAAVFIFIIIVIMVRKCWNKCKSTQPVSNDTSQTPNNECNNNNATASLVVSAENGDQSLQAQPLMGEDSVENGNHTNQTQHLIDEAINENGNHTNQIQHLISEAMYQNENRTNSTTQI